MDFDRRGIKAQLYTPPWLPALLGAEDTEDPALVYATVPVLYRAVQLRCNALAGVPVRVIRNGTEVEWPFPRPIRSLVWQTEAALLLSGVAYLLRVRARNGRLADIQWINPLTVSVEWDSERGQRIFRQQVQDRQYGPWTDDDVHMLREFDLRDDVLPTGTSPATVAMGAAQVARWATEFVWRFFEGGAMPVMVLGVETPSGVLPKDERERIEGFFRRVVEGVRNAWRVIALGAAVKPTPVTPPMADLDMSTVMETARKQVALAFGIPQTMLEDAANYATAAEHRMSFWSETVRPRARMMQDALNAVLRGTGLSVEFAVEELDIFQQDEAERARAYAMYVNAGMRPSVAAAMLGLDLPADVEYADLDPALADTSVAAPRRAPRADAARELRRWRRKAVRRAKAGGPPAVPFRSDAIPPALHGALQGALEACSTADDARDVFDVLMHGGTEWIGTS